MESTANAADYHDSQARKRDCGADETPDWLQAKVKSVSRENSEGVALDGASLRLQLLSLPW